MRRKTAPLHSTDGSTLVMDKEGILNFWQEHFSKLLNCESRVELETIDNVLQTLVRTELDGQPLLEGVRKAIKQMKNNKAYSTNYNHYLRAFYPKHNVFLLSARQVQGNSRKQWCDLYFALIVLTEAFDSVTR